MAIAPPARFPVPDQSVNLAQTPPHAPSASSHSAATLPAPRGAKTIADDAKPLRPSQQLPPAASAHARSALPSVADSAMPPALPAAPNRAAVRLRPARIRDARASAFPLRKWFPSG